MISERDGFGPALKAERDRRGITLQAIADSTKIGVSLLGALERNDMSRWPKGIFRRAFVREYVTALGLPPEPVVAEFVRLFPDEACPEVPLEPTEFRLMLESDPSVAWKSWRTRAIVASVEMLGVLAVGSLVAWLLDLQIWAACGGVALFYYPIASVCVERGPRPRLLFPPAGRVSWLHEPSRAIDRLRLTWSEQVPSDEQLGVPSAEETNEEATTSATGWRTAAN